MTAIARNRIPETSRAWAPATLACMGIVFGDIGTSPLYAFKEAAKAAIRAEDMEKGIFTTISQLPRQEPRKATLPASAAV